jgi:hypothetical protein
MRTAALVNYQPRIFVGGRLDVIGRPVLTLVYGRGGICQAESPASSRRECRLGNIQLTDFTSSVVEGHSYWAT